MRFIHISDLHLGKRLGEFRLYEEQSAVLDWILQTAVSVSADGILLAGDIFDRSVPPVEAVALFDSFLVRLSETGIPLLAISGNHDSPERIAYGSGLFDRSGIHFSPVFDGNVRSVLLEKDGERAYIHLLPFLKPIHVTAVYGTAEPAETEETEEPEHRSAMSYTEAAAEVLSRMTLPPDGINILLCHQFLTGSHRSESEEVPLVGTLDAVDASLFRNFDYVALGHLHRAQAVTEKIRYAGAPLAYAFSETEEKGCLLVEFTARQPVCTFLPVPPGLVRRPVTLEGTYDTLISRDFRENCSHCQDYLKIILDEDTPVPDAMAKLSVVYPRVVQLAYRRKDAPDGQIQFYEDDDAGAGQLSPDAVFASFYARQNETELSPEDLDYIRALLEEEGGAVCGR